MPVRLISGHASIPSYWLVEELRKRSSRCHTANKLSAMAAINAKVGISGKHEGIGKNFSHTHKAGVGEAHRNIGILLQKLQDRDKAFARSPEAKVKRGRADGERGVILFTAAFGEIAVLETLARPDGRRYRKLGRALPGWRRARTSIHRPTRSALSSPIPIENETAVLPRVFLPRPMVLPPSPMSPARKSGARSTGKRHRLHNPL